MVFQKCSEKFSNMQHKWFKPCQIKDLTNKGGNEKIDDFVQEMRLKICNYKDKVFEWISYDQFYNIKKIGNTVYSALWKDGPLEYSCDEKEYKILRALR